MVSVLHLVAFCDKRRLPANFSSKVWGIAIQTAKYIIIANKNIPIIFRVRLGSWPEQWMKLLVELIAWYTKHLLVIGGVGVGEAPILFVGTIFCQDENALYIGLFKIEFERFVKENIWKN